MNTRFNIKRLSIIAGLVLVELLVLGGIFTSIGGFHVGDNRPPMMGAIGSEAQETVEKTIDSSQNPQLSINNPVGSVIVKAWDKPQVRVEAVKRAYGETEDSAQAALKDVQVALVDKDGTVTVNTELPHPPAGAFSFPSTRFMVEYFIAAPSDTEIVDLNVDRGTADISGITGAIRQVTASGNVRVEDSMGDVVIRSARGGIYVSGAQGKLNLKANGEIQISDANGVSIDSTNSRGSFFFIGKLRPGEINHIQTQGSSSLILPSDSEVDLDLETQKGDIKVDFPVNGVSPTQGNQEAGSQVLKGIIGKPSTFLQVRSSSGAILIKTQN